MFRLIRLTLLLIVACAAAIFTVHLIGSTCPNPLAILFTNPEGTPCQRPYLLSVRPGDKTNAILESHPMISPSNCQRDAEARTVVFTVLM